MSSASTVLVPPASMRRAAVVIGPVLVVAIAWATSGVSETMAIADVALVLAIVTVVVALTTVAGGVVTSAAGALALNYFHTEPVHSLRMSESADVIAVLLLGLLGVIVSVITAARLRTIARDRHLSGAQTARRTLGTELLHDSAVDVVWAEAIAASSAGLALVDCRLLVRPAEGMPRVSLRRSAIDHGDDVFVLPETGAIVEFDDPRISTVLLLVPRAGAGAIELDRRVVSTFVDHLGLVLRTDVPAAAAS